MDRRSAGISQALGAGSHDLDNRVGGISMLQGLDALAADPATEVIVLISKPPAPEVAGRVLETLARILEPVVVDFLGADPARLARDGIHAASTLDEAAALAVALSRGEAPRPLGSELSGEHARLADGAASTLQPSQKFVRGLFSGGTFCYEALLLLEKELGPVHSNTPLKPEHRLASVWQSQGHAAVDLGDDLFTQGRPHPMIDFRLRSERIVKEASDPETAVILLDVVLGHGSHPDPAGELVPAIEQAREAARAGGRELAFVGFVCGTERDPQNLSRQEAALRSAGVILTDSNAQAGRLTAAIVGRMKEKG